MDARQLPHRFLGDAKGERDRRGHLLPSSFVPAVAAEPVRYLDLPTLAEFVAAGYDADKYESFFGLPSTGAGVDALCP